MQLRRLDVTNIRSYEAGRIDFPPGTTLIVGDVGAGKTSLLYAVEMALFGAAEVDAAYLVRHGAAHAEVAVRFEDGEHRYDIARRFRRVRRKGRDSFDTERITFREDGEPTAYSATEIRQRVIELLGFPDNPNPQAHSDLWRWAIYVPQERMREILSVRPQERLETVRKALGVERYRTAAENAQELAADLRTSARHRREEAERMSHFDLEFAEAQREGDRLRAERGALESSILRHGDAAATERAAVAQLEEVVRGADADEREQESLSREQASDLRSLAELARRQGEREAEIARQRTEEEAARVEAGHLVRRRELLAKAEARTAGARSAVDAQEATLRALAAATAELTAVERQTRELGARSTVAVRARDEVAAAIEAARAEGPAHEPPAPTPLPASELELRLTAARTQERDSVERNVRARTALEEVDELLKAGVCPRCQQPVHAEAYGPHRAEARRAAEEAELERTRAVRGREEAEAALKARERYERAHDRWVTIDRRRAELAADLARREAEFSEIESERREAERGLARARERTLALAPEEGSEGRLREDLRAAEAEVIERRREVERAALAEERVRSAGRAAGTLAAEWEHAERDRSLLVRRGEERALRLNELARRIASGGPARESLRGAKATLARSEETLAETRAALVRADTRLDAEVRRAATAAKGRSERAALIGRSEEMIRRAEWVAGPFRVHVLTMEQELLAHAQAAFDRNFARYFSALVDDPALVARTDSGFTPEVTIEGESTPAEALSGGERTGLALAFRLALASVVRSLGEVRLETLLLDEPTDGFSAEQVVRMGELLDELALPQVVVVSHEGELAAIADRTVRVVKESGTTRIEGEGAATDRPAQAALPRAAAPPRVRRSRPRD